MDEEISEAVDQAIFEAISQPALIQSGITSFVIIAAFVVLRFVVVHFIKGKKDILDQEQRRWINRINNATTVAILIALILIWAPQLQTFALSLTAVAVAIVLSTKELLMCLTGGFLRASTKAYDIGDWIIVDGTTGEVMTITAMTTIIEEIETKNRTYQFTGHTVQVPNSKFLTASIENARFVKQYVYHEARIVIPNQEVETTILFDKLQDISETHYEPYREAAIKFNKKIEKKVGVDFADPEPEVFLKTTDIGHSVYSIGYLAPTKEAAKLETNITRDFLNFYHLEKTEAVPPDIQKPKKQPK